MIKIVKKSDSLMSWLSEDEKEELAKAIKAINVGVMETNILKQNVPVELDAPLSKNVEKVLLLMCQESGWQPVFSPSGLVQKFWVS